MPAWACHKIEHELGGIYDVAHGAGLTAITASWMRYVYRERLDMFIKFAVRVWDVEYNFDEPERTALEGINRLEAFFRKVEMPVTLNELGVKDDRFDELASKCVENGPVGWFRPLDKQDVIEVLQLAR
jgi:alcohol dehydrogenase YqhD (iron-dependent ADH family)